MSDLTHIKIASDICIGGYATVGWCLTLQIGSIEIVEHAISNLIFAKSSSRVGNYSLYLVMHLDIRRSVYRTIEGAL